MKIQTNLNTMRTKFLSPLTAIIVFVSTAMAQVPQGINYQAVARNASGSIYPNTHISLSFSLHDGSASGNIIYQENRYHHYQSTGCF